MVVMLLDTSRAFDRVHYGCYLVLYHKKYLYLISGLILNSYLRHHVCVMWELCRSEHFKMNNGVKQGGLISCHLFNLLRLSKSQTSSSICVLYSDPLPRNLTHMDLIKFGTKLFIIYFNYHLTLIPGYWGQ